MKCFFVACRRLGILAAMTFRELLHQKINLLFAFLFFLFLAVGSLLIAISFQEKTLLFQEIFVGLFSLFLSLLAMVTSASILSSRGEAIMILARTVPRFEYFLGKILGVFLLLLMTTGCFGMLFLVLQCAWHIMFINPVFWVALLAAFLKACLLAAMTLLIVTMVDSSLFAIVVALAFYCIGHIEASTQQLCTRLPSVPSWIGLLTQGVMNIVPDMSLFNISEHGFTSLMECHSSLIAMVKWGSIYLVIYVLLGCFLFQQRESIDV